MRNKNKMLGEWPDSLLGTGELDVAYLCESGGQCGPSVIQGFYGEWVWCHGPCFPPSLDPDDASPHPPIPESQEEAPLERTGLFIYPSYAIYQGSYSRTRYVHFDSNHSFSENSCLGNNWSTQNRKDLREPLLFREYLPGTHHKEVGKWGVFSSQFFNPSVCQLSPEKKGGLEIFPALRAPIV